MSDIAFTVTDAGRAALVAAGTNGTLPVHIVSMGVSATAVTPAASATSLPGEIKRITTVAGAAVAGDTIHLTVQDASTDTYTVNSMALYLTDGTLFAIFGQATAILSKSSSAIFLAAADIKFASISAASVAFGNTDFLNPPATETVQGVAKLATQAIASAGTDDTMIVTPKKAKAGLLAWLGYTPANKAGDTFTGSVTVSYNNGAVFTLNNANSTGDSQFIFARGNVTRWTFGDSVGNACLYINRLNATGGYVDTPFQIKVSDGSVNLSITPTVQSAPIWHAANDGSGSGLDADTLDGIDSPTFARRDQANTFAGTQTMSSLVFAGGAGSSGLFGGNGDGASYATYNLVVQSWFGIGFRTFDGSVNGFYDARSGIWDVKTAYRVNGVPVWHAANDGAGSGLDADFLDGIDSGSFARRDTGNNFSASQTISCAGAALALNTSGGQDSDILFRRAGVTRWAMGDSVGNSIFYINLYDAGGTYLNTPLTIRLSDGLVNLGALTVSGNAAWHGGNDGAGSGLDADLLDGQDSPFYTNIPARLGYTPVQQGTGVGQLGNLIKVGWSGTRVKLTVDTTDQGNIVTDGYLSSGGLTHNGSAMQRGGFNLWGPDNDGSGSGLDADMLDGHHATDFALAQSFAGSLQSNGYQMLPTGLMIQWGFINNMTNQAVNTFNFPAAFPNACLSIVATLGTSFTLTGNHIGLGADAISKTQGKIAVASDSSGTIGAHWIAIGY